MTSFLHSPKRLFFLLLGLVSSACGSDKDCTDTILIAVSVRVEAPANLIVDKVTVEQLREELCGMVSAPEGGKVYQCWEQDGGGTYVVRVYSGEKVWSYTQELEGAGCHIRERVEITFDLSSDPAT